MTFALKVTIITVRSKTATNGTEKMIGDSLRTQPGNIVSSPKEAKKKLMANSFYAFTFVS